MCVAAIQGHSWLSQTHAIVLTACPTMVHMGREEESVRLGNSYIDFFFFFYYSDSVTLLSFVLILQKTNKTTVIKQKPTGLWLNLRVAQPFLANRSTWPNLFTRVIISSEANFFLYFCTKLPIS